MAETKTGKTTAAKSSKTPAQSTKGATTASKGPTKAASRKTAATAAAPTAPPAEPKTRFNAALEEAKAGAAALRAEAETRAEAVREQAANKGDEFVSEARAYGDKAIGKAGELAVEGKAAASDAIASLGKVVADTAPQIDEKLGEQYGDYARKASRGLTEVSAKLETKSLDELGDDAREFVRKSPATAVGIAAVFGFLVARLFRGSRD